MSGFNATDDVMRRPAMLSAGTVDEREAAAAADMPLVCYLFPDSAARRGAREAILGGATAPERYLFYGLDYLHRKGVRVMDNIGRARPGKAWRRAASRLYRVVVNKAGGLAGDLEPVLSDIGLVRKASITLCFSERIALQLLFLRWLGLAPRKPLIYITMGLPEKLAMIRSAKMLRRYIDELGKMDGIISLSKKEADTLANDYGLDETVRFIPAGVDADYFSPIKAEPDVDVLSIGADRYRDFETLVKVAASTPRITYEIITTPFHVEKVKSAPANVKVAFNVPMTRIKERLARAKVVALPVVDNSYSGATTVMLQAMAMGRPVIANRVGANEAGYPFESMSNCVFVPPGSKDSLREAIESLLEDNALAERIGAEARRVAAENLAIEGFHEKLCGALNEAHARKWGVPLF